MPKSAIAPTPVTDRRGRPLITPLGREQLEARINDIRERRLVELRPLLVEHERDERHVAEFEKLLEEAATIERFLAEAADIAIDARKHDGTVVLGSRVLVELPDGGRAWVVPVHPREAVLDDERISAESPLGSAILGLTAGGSVTVHAPTGSWKAKVLEVDIAGISGAGRASSSRATSARSKGRRIASGAAAR